MDKKAYLEQIDKVNREGRYKPDWDSLATHLVPAWYGEKRLGIFLHWGPFSVPAYHDWYARNMYMKGSPEYEHHLKHWGAHKDFGYKDFIPMLTMEKFNPAEWVQAFVDAGAEYIVPVAEHHDGYQMYRSELSHWNAVETGPHRDVLGDLLLEAERAGMTLGASSHRVEHWWFMSHVREFDSDIKEPLVQGDLYWPAMPEPDHQDLFSTPAPSDEYMTDWLLRCCELVDRYHPRIIYFDWWIQHSAVKPYLKRFAAYYYNRAEEWGGCVINYKHDAFPFGCAVPDIERGQFAQAKPFLWQSDTSTMRGSWCYSEDLNHAQFKSVQDILWDLIDVVSKNGRMLLNLGPKPDGTLAEKDLEILRGIGAWMRVNDEAIHGTGVWRVSEEGPTEVVEGQFADAQSRHFTSEDFRFTCRGSKIYAIAMACPEDGVLRIHSMAEADASHKPLFHGIIRDVQVLGHEGETTWNRDEEALHVNLGSIRSDLPLVVRVTVD